MKCMIYRNSIGYNIHDKNTPIKETNFYSNTDMNLHKISGETL